VISVVVIRLVASCLMRVANARPYPVHSGTLAVFKTTTDRSAERPGRPPELHATSNGLPEDAPLVKVKHHPLVACRPVHVAAGIRRIVPDPPRLAQGTRPFVCHCHMLVAAPTAGCVDMPWLLRRSIRHFPQLRCPQSPRAGRLAPSNMTGLKITIELEPWSSVPLMRIDHHSRTAACCSTDRPPLRLVVLRPRRFAFSDHADLLAAPSRVTQW